MRGATEALVPDWDPGSDGKETVVRIGGGSRGDTVPTRWGHQWGPLLGLCLEEMGEVPPGRRGGLRGAPGQEARLPRMEHAFHTSAKVWPKRR